MIRTFFFLTSVSGHHFCENALIYNYYILKTCLLYIPKYLDALTPYHTSPRRTSPFDHLLMCLKPLDEWQTVKVMIAADSDDAASDLGRHVCSGMYVLFLRVITVNPSVFVVMVVLVFLRPFKQFQCFSMIGCRHLMFLYLCRCLC